MSTTVAALYVDPAGVYSTIDGVDTWGPERDARTYDGPHPVVAHPPCSTWCKLASVNEARYGHPVGSDGGCFEAALRAVRRWGGVLEHPAYSKAWRRFKLNNPPRGGWVPDGYGGLTCQVAQVNYGHPAEKLTWLLVYGVDELDLPEIRWGVQAEPTAWVSWMANHGDRADRKRIGKKAAAATPPEFADLLVRIARTASGAA